MPSRQRHTLLGFAAVALFLSAWLAMAPTEPPDRDHTLVASPSESAIAVSATPSQALVPAPEASHRTAAAAPASPTATPTPPMLRVRLRGLHPAAPWSTPLVFDAWHFPRQPPVPVDPDGVATVVMPTGWKNDSWRSVRIRADDPNYRRVAHPFAEPLDSDRELVIDVQVVAWLEGRVVDADGRPAAETNVAAFVVRGTTPAETCFGATTTSTEGSWRMAVPPTVPLWLVAASNDGASPATTTATGRIGAPTTVPDLAMPRSSAVRGSVRWSDGAAIPDVSLSIAPRGDAVLRTSPAITVARNHGALSALTRTKSAADGSFTLAIANGFAADVQLFRFDESMHLARAPIVMPATTTSTVDFRVPRPVTVRATTQGAVVRQCAIEIEGDEDFRPFGNDDMKIVPNDSCRIRAIDPRRCSSWRTITPADSGTTVELDLSTPRCRVAIDFDGAPEMLSVRVLSNDARRGEILHRVGAEPFVVTLGPGHHHLRFGSGRGGHDGHFLMPVECDVTAGIDTPTVTVPARFGGTFRLTATDANGIHVAGTCRVIAATGENVTDRFGSEASPSLTSDGAPGVLHDRGANAFLRLLPPGDYDLQCDFVEHGARRTKVTIEARKVTEVRIRL